MIWVFWHVCLKGERARQSATAPRPSCYFWGVDPELSGVGLGVVVVVSVSVFVVVVDFFCFLCFFVEELWSSALVVPDVLALSAEEPVLPLIEPALWLLLGVCVSMESEDLLCGVVVCVS